MRKSDKRSTAVSGIRRVVKKKTVHRVAHKTSAAGSGFLSADDASRLNVLRYMAANGRVEAPQYKSFVKRLEGMLAKTIAKKIAPRQ